MFASHRVSGDRNREMGYAIKAEQADRMGRTIIR